MLQKEALARISINKLLEDAGWRFFPNEKGIANIQLEPNVKLKQEDLDGIELKKQKNGFVDYLLLDENGNLKQKGFAKSLILDYKKDMIKTKKSRIKEWDYYYIGNEHFGVALTVADNSYMSLASISFLNFDKPSEKTKSFIKFFSIFLGSKKLI